MQHSGDMNIAWLFINKSAFACSFSAYMQSVLCKKPKNIFNFFLIQQTCALNVN